MKRTELKRGKGLSNQSDKRKAQNRLRAVVLERLRRTVDGCQARCIRNCTGAMDDGHEIHTRGRGGSITDENNILMVCRPCHSWLTDHPAFSDEHGFTVHDWESDEAGMLIAAEKRRAFHRET